MPVASKPVLRVRTDRLHAVLLGDVALQRADGDGGVDRAAAAHVFAGRGADPAAHRREGIRRARDEVCLFHAALGDQLHVSARIGGDGAAGLTLDLGLPVREVGSATRTLIPPPVEQGSRVRSSRREVLTCVDVTVDGPRVQGCNCGAATSTIDWYCWYCVPGDAPVVLKKFPGKKFDEVGIFARAVPTPARICSSVIARPIAGSEFA